MKAMVLAAGVGSRLDPLTSQLPKPMVPVANRPVMEHILSLLQKNGVTDVISNLHYLPEKIQDYFGDGARDGVNLKFHYEAELTGDAGGVRACQSFFGSDTFIVVMGDLLTDADLSRIVAEHKNKKALATIAIKEVDDVSQFGVVLSNSEGFVTGFQEKPSLEQALSKFASTGIYILEPKIFEYIPPTGSYGFGRQLFPSLVERGLPILAVDLKAYWSDVGTIGQYRQANFDALNGDLHVDIEGKKTAWGFAAEDSFVSSTAQIEGRLILGKRSKIGSAPVIKGSVIIGDDCVIEDNVILEDCIVWSNTTIQADSQLRNCIVGSNCIVPSGSQHEELTAVQWPLPMIAR